MPSITIDIDLDDYDDPELVHELRARGYYVADDDTFEITKENKLDDDDLDLLLELVDKNNNNVYTNRVRDKLHGQRRYG